MPFLTSLNLIVSCIAVLTLISKILLAAEVVVLVLLAGIVGVIGFFGAAAVSDLGSLGILLAYILVGLGLIAAAALAYRHIRADASAEFYYRFAPILAIAGAVVATGVTTYGHFFMSWQERWREGIDFLGLGIFLWAPLAHLGILLAIPHAANNRLERRPQLR